MIQISTATQTAKIQKDKKAVSALTGVLIALIITILTLAILYNFVFRVRETTSLAVNKQLISNWLTLYTKEVIAEDVPKAQRLALPERPPIAILYQDPLKFETEEQLKKTANKEIAEILFNCWGAFHKGERDFLTSGFGFGKEVFCFPCAKLEFSDNLIGKGSITGLKSYLKSTAHTPGTAETYANYLSNIAPELFEAITPANDIISITQKNLYVYFFATTKDYWGFYILYGAQAGATIGAITTATPIGLVAGAAIGATAGFITAIFKEKDFMAMLIIKSPEEINQICNKEKELLEEEK